VENRIPVREGINPSPTKISLFKTLTEAGAGFSVCAGPSQMVRQAGKPAPHALFSTQRSVRDSRDSLLEEKLKIS